MKELCIKLIKCKNIKQIIEIIPNELLIKISYYSLSLWCLLPILIMITNIFTKGLATTFFFTFLILVGVLGIINGISYVYKNNIKIYKKQPFILLLIFLGWTFISCIFAENKFYSFIGSSYRHEGFITYILYVGFFMNGLVISKNSIYIKKLLNNLLISSSIICLLIFMNNNLTDILLKGVNHQSSSILTGIFSNTNHFGYYLCICILASAFLFLYEKKNINKIIYLICYLLLIYILEKNATLGCWLSVFVTIIVAVVYYLIIKENRLKIFLILLLFTIMNFTSLDINKDIKKMGSDFANLKISISEISNSLENPEQNISDKYEIVCSGSGRIDLWVKGIELIKRKLLFGYGLENLKKPYSQITICHKTDRPHNIFIQVGATSGVIGLILYMASIFTIFITGLKKHKKLNKMIICCFFICTGYIYSSFFGVSMYYTTPYFIMLLGIVSSVCLNKQNDLESLE